MGSFQRFVTAVTSYFQSIYGTCWPTNIIDVPPMSTTVPRSPGSDVAASAHGNLPEPVGQVLRSRAFEKTPALRALLVFLWQHREEPISEYAIATEALGRRPVFDARTDATVRVQISRLRQRLERFYDLEGRHATGRLVIPLGSHQVHVEASDSKMAGAHSVNVWAAEPEKRDMHRPMLILAIVCVVLAIACAVLGTELLQTRHAQKPRGRCGHGSLLAEILRQRTADTTHTSNTGFLFVSCPDARPERQHHVPGHGRE